MVIKIKVSQKELESMNLTKEQLEKLAIEKFDSTTHKGMKIFHQVELELSVQ